MLLLGIMTVPVFADTVAIEQESNGGIEQNKELEEGQKTRWEQILERLPHFSGYLQTGWNYNSQGEGTNSFQAKRLRLLMDGYVTKQVSFSLQVEAFNGVAESANKNGQKNLMVLDAFVTAKINQAFQVRVGQYCLPMGFENNDLAPGILETVDFSNICNRMVGRNAIGYDFEDYGRDLGIMAFGDFLPSRDGCFNYMSYYLSVTNGHLPNLNDNNKSKDLIGSFVVRPFKNMSVMASYNWGKYDGSVGGKPVTAQVMNRMIAGIWYHDSQGLNFRTEYGYITSGYHGKQVREKSLYSLVGWHVGKFLPLVRYDFYRDEVNRGTLNNYDRFLVGVSYKPFQRVRLQANYAYSLYTPEARKMSNDGKQGSNQVQIMGIFSF